MWNDGVAPETAIDFDAPNFSPLQGLLMWFGGLGFFYSVFQLAVLTNHPENKPTVS